ncbi:hypothetical protein HHK36_012479 [Tetracentron sinense]|uniref:CCT domain-containing protein n=1 Tax=Tetracentron sinense TaxID=13715 RepID=A0A835DI47_TETSI|nr:hypothetical protein HHK36_012479 [Tetracentron sinense]
MIASRTHPLRPGEQNERTPNNKTPVIYVENCEHSFTAEPTRRSSVSFVTVKSTQRTRFLANTLGRSSAMLVIQTQPQFVVPLRISFCARTVIGTNMVDWEKSQGGKDCLVASGLNEQMEVVNGFSNVLPSIVNHDDLISTSSHDFPAMRTPLPKNRSPTCGKHKEEVLHQLRELLKLEPNLNNDNGEAEALLCFQPLVPELDLQSRRVGTSSERDSEPIILPGFEASSLQWRGNNAEAADQVPLPFSLLGSYLDESSLILDKPTYVHGGGNNVDAGQHPIITETLPVLPKTSPQELTSHDRDSMISRYDKQILYESRKARAQGMTRIKGRFAKVDH